MCNAAPDVRFALSSTLDSPSRARRFVVDNCCPEHGRLVGDALALVTTELVTKAVLHGAPPVALQLSCRTHRMRVSVGDGGPPLARSPGPSGESGWGLLIVAELSTAWGTRRSPRARKSGACSRPGCCSGHSTFPECPPTPDIEGLPSRGGWRRSRIRARADCLARFRRGVLTTCRAPRRAQAPRQRPARRHLRTTVRSACKAVTVVADRRRQR